jgi:hypothetical protein
MCSPSFTSWKVCAIMRSTGSKNWPPRVAAVIAQLAPKELVIGRSMKLEQQLTGDRLARRDLQTWGCEVRFLIGQSAIGCLDGRCRAVLIQGAMLDRSLTPQRPCSFVTT